jgi:hypothetical protein
MSRARVREKPSSRRCDALCQIGRGVAQQVGPLRDCRIIESHKSPSGTSGSTGLRRACRQPNGCDQQHARSDHRSWTTRASAGDRTPPCESGRLQAARCSNARSSMTPAASRSFSSGDAPSPGPTLAHPSQQTEWSSTTTANSPTSILSMRRTSTLESDVTPSSAAIGDPSGPALLLLPGPTDSWRTTPCSSTFQPRFGPSRYRSVATVTPTSRRPGIAWRTSPPTYRCCSTPWHRRAVLAGHSGSCLVARRVGLDHRERVSGLVLEASPTILRGDARPHGVRGVRRLEPSRSDRSELRSLIRGRHLI